MLQIKLKFKNVFLTGEKSFKKYLKKNEIQPPKSEEKAYFIIKNA